MVVFGCMALSITALCIVAAQRMAGKRARLPRAWMWAAAFLGPLPLVVLACLSKRDDRV
jgi:hypothetical protein